MRPKKKNVGGKHAAKPLAKRSNFTDHRQDVDQQLGTSKEVVTDCCVASKKTLDPSLICTHKARKADDMG